MKAIQQQTLWNSSKSNDRSVLFTQKLIDPMSWIKGDSEEKKGFQLSSNVSFYNNSFKNSFMRLSKSENRKKVDYKVSNIEIVKQ
jgi:hypothetical protein